MLNILSNRIYFFLVRKILGFFYRNFGIHLILIIPKEYFESGEYIITESICASCGRYTKNFFSHEFERDRK